MRNEYKMNKNNEDKKKQALNSIREVRQGIKRLDQSIKVKF